MAFIDTRPPSKEPCKYWTGTACRAVDFFPEDSITCFNEGNCNGFGTCRGCTRYDQGGLKIDNVDGQGGSGQTPLNLQMYNLRSRIAPCCFWEGDVIDFSKKTGTLGEAHSPFIDSSPSTPQTIPADFPVLNRTPTKCTQAAAAPWQTGFTPENPTAYGCNGAKPECPFYTGPKFTEVVDAKMDTGNRVTAKQVMELRFYSENWRQFDDPREVWESRFEQADIWAWVKDPTSTSEFPGKGRFDEFSNPLVQKVSVTDLTAETPSYTVGSPVTVSTVGTTTVGLQPNYPDLIREISLLSTGLKIIWPAKTSPDDPLIRKTFTKGERRLFIAAQITSNRQAYAVNLTKQPQGSEVDLQFIRRLQRESPEDVIFPISADLPGKTFPVPLVFLGSKDKLNHIRIYLDVGSEDGSMFKADVYVRHIFYHAEVGQTTFIDLYGHGQIDPWINHFTEFTATANFYHLTGNTEAHDVLWNTVATNGKKTIYAIEEVVETSTANGDLVSWEPIGCGHIVVTFHDPKVNRVYPWQAWDTTGSTGEQLFVKIDRSGNSNLLPDEPVEVVMELALASTKGSSFPANIAFFKVPGNQARQPFDVSKDVLVVKYAYTDYKQGPIAEGDEFKLKFPEDASQIIDQFVYDHSFDTERMEIAGTFLKTTGDYISNCDQILGTCFATEALANEQRAITSFFAGGLEESNVKQIDQMLEDCKQQFDANFSGTTFEDGSSVSYGLAASKLSDMYLHEGSLHYTVIFKDEEGRPIGSKKIAFLAQSAVAQTRDVEIYYKWTGQAQHFPVQDSMIILATFHKPTFATTNRLVRVVQQYVPYCGDHRDNTQNPLFGAFDLATDGSGPLWYPYSRCLTPSYHADDSSFTNPVHYSDVVEGFQSAFGTSLRRDYWEKMRFFDEYMPAIMDYIPQIGCFWSERTTTVNIYRPVFFTGYTRIRSANPFGPYDTDRESLRLSRHWEKRNLSVIEETLTQEDGGFTVSLSQEFKEILFDANGDLRSGSDTQTPVWVHINDGLSVVSPGTEDIIHPFSRYLMSNVGDFSFGETFDDSRLTLNEAFAERDYTNNLERSEDGSQIFLSDGTKINDENGFIREDQGQDIRWVYSSPTTGWAWMSDPPAPERSEPRITGLYLSNPATIYFKENRVSAVHTTEGTHILKYEPHEFDDSGSIEKAASISLDGGPELLISQTDGEIFILADQGSPYDFVEHLDEEYTFVLHGNGPGGLGILADNRGLQRYEIRSPGSSETEKFATLAGININLVFDINELPYEVRDIRFIERLFDASSQVSAATTSYTSQQLQPVPLSLDFAGHYFVESIVIDFSFGVDFDIPNIIISGQLKEVGQGNVFEANDPVLLFPQVGYTTGTSQTTVNSQRKTFNINQRLFNLSISVGARQPGRSMRIENIQIFVRNHIARQESVFIYEPRCQLSAANTGTHKPSDLEFFFQRSYPDWAKNFLSGQLSLGDLGGFIGTDVTAIPGVQVKYIGRQVKDLLPVFEFSDPINTRFPYNNIDITAINGYTTEQLASGLFEFIGGEVSCSSKGWTLQTNRHFTDPVNSLTPTDFGPEGLANVQSGDGLPNEELQEALYEHAGSLLGDKLAVYDNFWHPAEVEFFADSGVDITNVNWTLQLRSTIAPLSRVFRHDNYGCIPSLTNELSDGTVHKIPNWQAKGVFHYSCDPRYSWACFTTVMNKCNEFIYKDFGTPKYETVDVVDRFTYVFKFHPKDYASYIASGLINRNEIGGIIGGTGPVGNVVFASVPAPRLDQLVQTYSVNQGARGGAGGFQ